MHHATESQANARCARARAGNGSQWSKMAQPLLRSSAVFRRAIQACAEAVAPHGLNLLAEFEAEGGWSQPAIAMVGLVAVQARGLPGAHARTSAALSSSFCCKQRGAAQQDAE
jgi:acyl transferase domain-containing protein